MNYLFLILTLFFGVDVSAQSASSNLSDSLIDKPKSLASPEVKAGNLPISSHEEKNISQSSHNAFYAENEKQASSHILTFGLAPSVQNYELKGSGFHGSLENENGYGIYGKFKYSIDQIHWLSLLYIKSKATLISPSTIRPSDILISRDFLAPAYHYRFFSKMLELYAGPAYLNQVATKTSPKSLVSSFNSIGFLVGTSINSVIFWNSWQVKASTSFYLPISLKEKDYSTGKFENGLVSNADLLILKKISEKVSISIGSRFYYESYQFSGTGNRGTVNGKIISKALSFPIEVEYKL